MACETCKRLRRDRDDRLFSVYLARLWRAQADEAHRFESAQRLQTEQTELAIAEKALQDHAHDSVEPQAGTD